MSGASSFPTSIAGLAAWQKANRATAEEARRRLVQFVVLASIAYSAKLFPKLVLKGGNALRFVHGNSRSTLDLDFTAEGDFPDDPDTIRAILDAALQGTERQFQVKARCQKVKRNPTSLRATFPTYAVKVGFQLPGDRHYHNFDGAKSVASVVDLEISLNDVVCETIEQKLDTITRPVRVCSLEDVLAEKLRAILQQAVRQRNRPQDVYDVASRMRTSGDKVDTAKVTQFLISKSAARAIEPRKSSYNDEARRLALENYEAEIGAQAAEFIPFDEAWVEVLSLIGRLGIPV